MARPSARPMADINVTSLVDVSLVLLIIFMITAPFIQAGVEVELPETTDTGVDVREGLVLSVGADRTVYLGDDPVPLDNLASELARRYDEQAGRTLYMRADQGVPYGFVVQVMALAKSAGFVHLGLVTQPDQQGLFGASD